MTPIEELISTTAQRFAVTLEQIYSHSRLPHVVEARHMAAYVLWKRYPELSFATIATLLDRRNVTAIMCAVRAIERRASVDDAYARFLVELLATATRTR